MLDDILRKIHVISILAKPYFEAPEREKKYVFAYYQIGRDVLSGSSNQVWYSNVRDNLRIIRWRG